MRGWPTVKLSEVARPVARAIAPQPGTTYRQIGVRLWGEGAYERESLDGSATKYSTLFAARAADIIVNKIWARNGSVAVVPPSLEGAVGSGEFPMFEVDQERLLPLWMHWLTKTPGFWMQCDAKSQGTSGKNRIRPDQFLSIAIPLPSLPEQQRLVARVEDLAAELTAASMLCASNAEEAAALLLAHGAALFNRLAGHHSLVPFGACQPHVTSGPRNWGSNYAASGFRFYRAQDIGADGEVAQDGKVFVLPPDGQQGRSAMPCIGDLLVVITGATVGRVACVGSEHEPGYVSQHVAICRLAGAHWMPRYAWWGLRLPFGQSQLVGQRYGQGKPGLNLANIRALTLPCPAVSEQRRIVAELDALRTKVDALKTVQAARRAELDALLPAILDRAFGGALQPALASPTP